mmetsp:Transcript_1737/g.4914  ORF Transcript_1737/g.4914 Transcript_1737/m.4914 type:complete len:211 (+) Transcript_1737:728-1360(+)
MEIPRDVWMRKKALTFAMTGRSTRLKATSITMATTSAPTAFTKALSYMMPRTVSVIVPANIKRQRKTASFCSASWARAAFFSSTALGFSSMKFLPIGITMRLSGIRAMRKGTWLPKCFMMGPTSATATRPANCRPNHTKVIRAGPCSGFARIFSAYLASVSRSQVDSWSCIRKRHTTRRPTLMWSWGATPMEAQAAMPKTDAMIMYGALW